MQHEGSVRGTHTLRSSDRAAARQPSAATDKIAVLFVHSATRPPLGADTFVHSLIIGALDRTEFEVHVACVPGDAAEPTPTFKVISAIPDVRVKPVNLGRELFTLSRRQKLRAALEGFPALHSFAGLVRYIRRHEIRVLHTSDRPRDALACILLGRLTGARCIIHVHVAFGEWMKPILKWSMARADALIGVSDFVARTLIAGGYAPEKTHAVLNAIDPSAWDPKTQPGSVRQELGIPADAPLVTCVARIFRAKGQVELIQALKRVTHRLPAARLLLVGQDYPPGTSHSSELKQLAAELAIEPQVIFAGQRRDVPRLLAASDVLAMASFEEPFGLVYLEAMAMGLPVVAYADGGTVEVVEHGQSGLLAASGDVPALADHLLTLLTDPDLRDRMGRYGRRQVEAKFCTERLGRDVAQVYRALLA